MIFWLQYLGYTSLVGGMGNIMLRAVFACLSSLLLSFLLASPLIRFLLAAKMGQAVSTYAPQGHLNKAGTPTMGGALIILSVLIATVVWARLDNPWIWIVLFAMLSLGTIGWIDDWRKIVLQNNRGLSTLEKYGWQSVCIGLVIGAILFVVYARGGATMLAFSSIVVPFYSIFVFHSPLVLSVLAYFVLMGASNAVNLTDGLDGLATLPSVMIMCALGIFAYVAGNAVFSSYLQLPFVPGTGELAVFCGAVVGAGFGFLWFNAYPAQLFMGDVGSLSLGGALGTVAFLVRQELAFFIMSTLFVVETLSVLIQLLCLRYRWPRPFRMAPLHHHFELKGWPENHIVVRFWIITMLFVLVGLSSLRIH